MSDRTTGLVAGLHQYMLKIGPEPHPVVAALRDRIHALDQAGWETAPEQLAFMAVLARAAGVERYLEIGTFCGFGTLAMALALPAHARIVTCDIGSEFPAIGQPYWVEAGVSERIDLRIAPAAETLDQILTAEGENVFDMAFIDADKRGYPDYYAACLRLVRPGGLILIDNVFWKGAVCDPEDQRKTTAAIRALNGQIAGDPRVRHAVVPIGDGLTIAEVL